MKETIIDKVNNAIEAEGLSVKHAAQCIGLRPAAISGMRKQKNWKAVGITEWDKARKWTNSGETLIKYAQKNLKDSDALDPELLQKLMTTPPKAAPAAAQEIPDHVKETGRRATEEEAEKILEKTKAVAKEFDVPAHDIGDAPRGYVVPDWLKNTWQEWLTYRSDSGKPYISQILKDLAMQKLINLSGGDPLLAHKIVNHSIVNGWIGFFPLGPGSGVSEADKQVKSVNEMPFKAEDMQSGIVGDLPLVKGAKTLNELKEEQTHPSGPRNPRPTRPPNGTRAARIREITRVEEMEEALIKEALAAHRHNSVVEELAKATLRSYRVKPCFKDGIINYKLQKRIMLIWWSIDVFYSKALACSYALILSDLRLTK